MDRVLQRFLDKYETLEEFLLDLDGYVDLETLLVEMGLGDLDETED